MRDRPFTQSECEEVRRALISIYETLEGLGSALKDFNHPSLSERCWEEAEWIMSLSLSLDTGLGNS